MKAESIGLFRILQEILHVVLLTNEFLSLQGVGIGVITFFDLVVDVSCIGKESQSIGCIDLFVLFSDVNLSHRCKENLYNGKILKERELSVYQILVDICTQQDGQRFNVLGRNSAVILVPDIVVRSIMPHSTTLYTSQLLSRICLAFQT